MSKISISVINQSTVLTDDQVKIVLPALQKQVDDHFGPPWGIAADLNFVSQAKADLKTWWLVILDDSDQANALGYHDLTDAGLPLAKVFARSDLRAGASWTVTCSHELLEMLADPNINLTVFDEGPIGARLYAYEVCDACEDDQFGYKIGDVLVSDFVYPSWFESFRAPKSTQFDFCERIEQPLQLLPGGYIGINDLASGIGWYQLTPEDSKNARARPPQGSRRQRRAIPPGDRMRSSARDRSAR